MPARQPTISLQRLSTAELQALATGTPPAALAPGQAADAWPPAFVARRALALQAEHPAAPLAGALYGIWWQQPQGQALVGSCGFKDAATEGWTEIGYGIARQHRRQGLGRQAVAALCRLAWAQPHLRVLRACIEPANGASAALVQGLGFEPGWLLREADGTDVVVWSLPSPGPGAGGLSTGR
jgi:RimJ/RimL family protein N-acetyltransferase